MKLLITGNKNNKYVVNIRVLLSKRNIRAIDAAMTFKNTTLWNDKIGLQMSVRCNRMATWSMEKRLKRANTRTVPMAQTPAIMIQARNENSH